MAWKRLSTDESLKKQFEKIIKKDKEKAAEEKEDKYTIGFIESLKAIGAKDQSKIEEFEQQLHIAKELQYMKMRQDYSRRVFIYMCCYSIFCVVIIFLQGYSAKGFHIDPTSLSVLIGSTAVSAIGLVLAVIKGLFK